MRFPKSFVKAPSWQRIYFLLRKNWDILFILIIFLCLFQQMLIVSMFELDNWNNRPWWEWSMREGWDVNGRVPKYGHYLNSSVPFEIDKSESMMQEYTQFANRRDNFNSEDEKIILFSFPPFSEMKLYHVDSHKCGGRCMISYDASLIDYADVVLFHFTDPKPMPKRKFPRQLYAWLNLESPSATVVATKEYPGVTEQLSTNEKAFNLTMTYRRDSDIYFPYKTLYEVREAIRNVQELEDMDLLMKSKDKLVAWASGNCGFTKGGEARMRLITNFLVLGLDIDIFGYCVNNRLPGGWEKLPEQLRRYKFYFSFENSLHCRDYITEKVWWTALFAGAVPVIWGPMKKDVEALLPEGAYIFVEDYSTPQELIDYLNYLDSNANAYREYFRWRSFAVPERIPGRTGGEEPWKTSEVVGFCQLCYMLYDDERYEKEHGVRPRRVVKSLASWWYEEETKTCLTPWSKSQWYWSHLRKTMLSQEYKFCSIAYMRYFVVAYIVMLFLLLMRRWNKAKTINKKYAKH